MLRGGQTHSRSDEQALDWQPIIAIVVICSTFASRVRYMQGRSKIEKERWTRGANHDGRFNCANTEQHLAS